MSTTSKQVMAERIIAKCKEVVAKEDFEDVFEYISIDGVKLFYFEKQSGNNL